MAAAVIVQTLWSILRCLGGDGVKIPKVSQVLSWFSLPVMARSMAEDEKSEEAREMFESVRRLKERMERNGDNRQT